MSRTKFNYAILFAFAYLIMFTESLHAQTSPPLLSTDPGTPGPGNWEINILTSLEHSHVSDEWQAPLFDVNFGVGHRWQLSATIPYMIDYRNGSVVRHAFDGIEMGVKYRFVDNPGATGSNFSVYPKIFHSFVDEKSTKWSLPVEWHREWSHFGLTAELGHIWVNGQPDGWEGGVAAALLLDPVSIAVEGHTSVREVPYDLVGPMVTFGFTWEWSKTVSLFASFGRSLDYHEDAATSWILAGFQFHF